MIFGQKRPRIGSPSYFDLRQRQYNYGSTTIYFEDKGGVRSYRHAGTTRAIKGKTPVVSSTGARFGRNLISAVSAQSELCFMTVNSRLGEQAFLGILKRLLQNAECMIF
jgi:hypothetical protein